jgi:catechol 2,3-dioxygenase-like lactoylglutathione lyase family enzyme
MGERSGTIQSWACEDRRMKVHRICFLGTRTPNFDATSTLFRDVLGLGDVHTEVGWSIFQLPSGRSDFVEVFGPEHENASIFPAEVTEGIVVAFAVDDIVGAREELVAAKVELIGDLVWANELFDDPNMAGFGWFFFRGPDGNVYVIQQDSRQGAI